MRYIKNPFRVKVKSKYYYCFGYDELNCYIKKVNSNNKYFKVYKVSVYHVMLTKTLLNKIYKAIKLCRRFPELMNVKNCYYYDHYNIHKNYRREHKKFGKLLKKHNDKFN
jgi:hypothetical protein